MYNIPASVLHLFLNSFVFGLQLLLALFRLANGLVRENLLGDVVVGMLVVSRVQGLVFQVFGLSSVVSCGMP